jgi:hypothetical protein
MGRQIPAERQGGRAPDEPRLGCIAEGLVAEGLIVIPVACDSAGLVTGRARKALWLKEGSPRQEKSEHPPGRGYVTSGFSGSCGLGVGTSSPGIRYFSPSHRAKSISRQRSLQKGRARLSAGSNHLSQMGHRHWAFIDCRKAITQVALCHPVPSS